MLAQILYYNSLQIKFKTIYLSKISKIDITILIKINFPLSSACVDKIIHLF